MVLFGPWRTGLALPWTRYRVGPLSEGWTTVRKSYSRALEEGPLPSTWCRIPIKEGLHSPWWRSSKSWISPTPFCLPRETEASSSSTGIQGREGQSLRGLMVCLKKLSFSNYLVGLQEPTCQLTYAGWTIRALSATQILKTPLQNLNKLLEGFKIQMA